MDKSKKILAILVLLLAVLNVFFTWKYATLQANLQAAKVQLAGQNSDKKVLDFMRIFIEKVLRAKKDVSFDDRLKLETMVRGLNDNQVLDQWNKFVNSKDQSSAQEEVKNLLSLLVQKALSQ